MATDQLPIAQDPGSQLYGPVNVPGNVTRYEVRFANWPSSATLAVDVEFSPDAGQTWSYAGGMNPTPGNRSVGRDGTADASFNIGPMPTGPQRRLRATVTVVGARISTLMTITTT